jgi:FkbM family methyltransferase
MMQSGETGGAEALYRGLVNALRAASHDVDQVQVPVDESTFDGILESYARCYDLDPAAYELVISTKAPTFMVRHPHHVSYLLHTIRVFYDMFEREYGAGTPEQLKQRALIHHLDREGLHPSRIVAHFTNGHQTYERLYEASPFWRQIPFRALHHPPFLEGFHASQQGEFVFLPSRLHRWKRVDLMIEAYKHVRANLPLKIAGTGEDQAALRALAGADARIEFLGRVSDAQLLDLYARALVVPFVPQKEDYGLVTIEAFQGGKPVITCTDSGEPTRFVRHHETGFVVEPDPRALAEKIDWFAAHPDCASEMGLRGRAAVSHINWNRLVTALTTLPVKKSWQGISVVQANEQTYPVTVLDMQPIEPPIGGGRIRLLGLYHGLGSALPTTYIGTYDWRGEPFREHQHSASLKETTIPLREEHFAAAERWQTHAGGKNVIDLSFDALAHHSPEFVAAAREHAARAEIVVFSHPWVYPLVKAELSAGKQLVVYDSQNVEGLLRAGFLDDGAFGTALVKHVARIEWELCRRADLILACSHQDRLLFHELYQVPFSKIHIVPNGTFTERIVPSDERAREQTKRELELNSNLLAIFVGSAYSPNVEGAEFICQTLAPALPDVAFAICGGVGTQLEPALYAALPNVRVTGYLDDAQVNRYRTAADIALNPMFSGSGTNIKMFDFMAAGLPIISTPIGARGIRAGDPPVFQTCDAKDFVEAIRGLAENPARARDMGNAARRHAKENYSWERISAQLGAKLHRERAKLTAPHPRMSVIVASYDRPALLAQLLESLRAQTFRDFEVIVVDQSSSPAHEIAGEQELDLLYIHSDRAGAVHSRNLAAFYARGEFLAFTDDDCQPLPDWLANAERYFDTPTVAGVEGLILSERREDPNYRAVTNEGFEGQGFMTANLFLRRKVFNALDGFDERFDHPHFREDTDLGWRALAHGEIPFARDVRVYHPPHLRDHQREAVAERVRFFEKDALLLAKHPERYRTLFLNEAHYHHTPGFQEHFLRGAEKYGVAVDEFYLNLLKEPLSMEHQFGDERDRLVQEFVALLRDYAPLELGRDMNLADAFFAYRLLLWRNPDLAAELPHLLANPQTVRQFVWRVVNSSEFYQTGGLLPPNRLMMTEWEDLRFWFNTSDREMGVRMALGLYEPRTVELVREMVKPGMKCIDVGAQSGFYTCVLAQQVGKKGKVYAFEPLPSSFEMLERNVRENQLQSRVRAFPLAASNTNESIQASRISNMYVAGAVEGAECVAINAARLDDLIDDKIDLVKIDVEGHEPAAIRGMENLIRTSQPIIFSEVNEYWLRNGSGSSAREYIGQLRSLGYQVYAVDNPDKPLQDQELELDALGSMDVIAMPLANEITPPKSGRRHSPRRSRAQLA